MANFTVSITDAAKLAGITAAREAYNAAIPASEPNPEFDPENPEAAPALIVNPSLLIETDAEYVQFVMSRAAESYANQYGTGGA